VASTKDMDELKKKFIVDESTYETEQMKGDLERLLQFCKITSKGNVLITDARLTDKKKVGLVIVARYIGNKLDKKIPEVVTSDEIVTFTKIDKLGVNARAKEIVDVGFASREEKGKYRANPGRISDFLDSILVK
jgi:hypothetical protein